VSTGRFLVRGWRNVDCVEDLIGGLLVLIIPGL